MLTLILIRVLTLSLGVDDAFLKEGDVAGLRELRTILWKRLPIFQRRLPSLEPFNIAEILWLMVKGDGMEFGNVPWFDVFNSLYSL